MQSPTSTPVQIRDVVRILARRKVLLFTPWIMAVGLGVAASILLPPVYSSSVTLLLERPQPLSGALNDVVSPFDPERQAANMRDQLQSTLFLRGVITATGLTSDPVTRLEALKHADPLAGSSPDERIEAYLINRVRDAVSVKRAKGSNTFQVSVEDRRPDRARRLAEGVANQFILQSKSAQIEAVRRTQEFSVEQEQIYKRKVEESEARLDAFKRGQLSTTLTGSPVGETNLARVRTLLDQSNLDVDEAQQRLTGLRQQYKQWTSSFDPAKLSNAETNAMAAQIKGLERQIAASAVLGDGTNDNSSSARGASARKTSELEMQFTQNASEVFSAAPPEARDALVRLRLADVDLQARQARHDYLASQVTNYENRVVMSPDNDAQLKRLEQDVENDRALYNSFLQQSANAQITEAFENARVSGRFSVLEPARLPTAPEKPNRVMLILLGLVLGGAVGVGSVFVVERHDQSMRNAEEVEILLGLPVVGAIPRVEELDRRRQRRRRGGAQEPQRDPGLLHRLKTESPLGLEFRRIFLKLAQSRGRTLPRTLLITSSTRGEGKSTTSACLAITLAREVEERILLVDFDLRSPALHRALGIPSSSWGVGHMLAQRKFDERFVRSTVLNNLDFLGAGKSERPASELVDSESVEWFMNEARARYPIVILDTAPTLAVPDPLIVGRAVEGVLYVVKAGQTVRKAAEYGVKVQREAKDNIIGVLLNDAGEILPHYYGYHDAYGYASEAVSGDS